MCIGLMGWLIFSFSFLPQIDALIRENLECEWDDIVYMDDVVFKICPSEFDPFKISQGTNGK